VSKWEKGKGFQDNVHNSVTVLLVSFSEDCFCLLILPFRVLHVDAFNYTERLQSSSEYFSAQQPDFYGTVPTGMYLLLSHCKALDLSHESLIQSNILTF